MAILELEHKREIFKYVSEDFEDVAYYEMKAAEARVNSIIKEEKESGLCTI